MKNIYSRTKIFDYPEKIKSLIRDSETILPPVHIRIKPTNACNHKCWYCSYRLKGVQLGKDMILRDSIPHDKMMEIVDDIIEMKVAAVTFSGGGEPLLYPYLVETAERLAAGGVSIGVLTNGAHLKDKKAEVLAEHATWLRISIDGWDAASYADYRGVTENEFETVITNLKAFKKLAGSRCFLGVSIPVDQKNAEKIYLLIQMVRDCGADNVKIAPCIISNSGKETNAYHADIEPLVKSQLTAAIEDLSTDTFEIFDSYHKQLETFLKTYDWCPWVQINPVIAADQNVYTCHDKAYNLDTGLLGSLKSQRFKKMWKSSKAQFFKLNPRRDCNHHCVADGTNRMLHDFISTDPDHRVFV